MSSESAGTAPEYICRPRCLKSWPATVILYWRGRPFDFLLLSAISGAFCSSRINVCRLCSAQRFGPCSNLPQTPPQGAHQYCDDRIESGRIVILGEKLAARGGIALAWLTHWRYSIESECGKPPYPQSYPHNFGLKQESKHRPILLLLVRAISIHSGL
jgi:hypothetical protein